MTDPKTVSLASLNVGDIFWYLARGWVVRGEVENGKRRVDCVDDGGEVVLPANITVEDIR